MIISLLGFMASGKSTIGRMLADKLDMNFIDLDVFIEGHEGRAIGEIFTHKGERHFRKLETKYLNLVVSTHKNVVLSLGGGTPCQERNWKAINETNAVYLYKTNEQLFDRLKSRKHKRPLIAGMSDDELQRFIKHKMKERGPFYERADYRADVLESRKETMERIIHTLKFNGE